LILLGFFDILRLRLIAAADNQRKI